MKRENLYHICCVVLLVFFFLHCANVQAYSNYLSYDYFYFRSLTIDNKLPHTDANAVLQDKKGFIWIATYSGLACYDGYSVKTFYNEQGGPDKAYTNRIFDLCIDDSGLLWMATSAGVQVFDTNVRRFLSVQINKTDKEEVYELEKIMVSSKGDLLLIKTNTNHLVIYDIKPNLQLERQKNVVFKCHSLWKDKKDNIWIGTDKGCFLFCGMLMTQYVLPSSVIKEEGCDVYFVFVDSDNNIWIATKDHLYVGSYDVPDSKKEGTIKIAEKSPIDFSSGLITDMVEDKKGHFWISSTKGLYLLKKYSGRFMTTRILADGDNTNLKSDFIVRLFIDRSENLFVSTYAGGVNMLDLQQRPFYLLQHEVESRNTLSESVARAVADSHKYLWIGTNSRGLNRLDKETRQFTVFQKDNNPNSIGGNAIRALLNDGNKYLWIGHDKGLDRLNLQTEPVSFQHMNDAFHLPEKEVTSLAKDVFGQIWVGTWNNGICRIRRQENGDYHLDFMKGLQSGMKALSPSRVITIYADPVRPEVFYSSGKQLIRLFLDAKGDVVKSYVYQAIEGNANSLNSNFVCDICRENDSILWVGTLGGGLNKLTLKPNGNYKAQHFTAKDGFGMKDVECLEMDDAGNIWAGGNELIKYSPKSGIFQNYSLINGEKRNGYKIGGSCIGENGYIYMAGIRGVTFFNPEEIKNNLTDARPCVSFISLNNQDMFVQNKVALNYLQNNIEVHLTALHYNCPALCRYKYRLIGYDDNWKSLPAMDNVINFANLPYRDYVLEVKATNNDGKWSSEIYSLPISVSAPWWLTIYCKILYVVLTIIVIVLIYIYLLRWNSLKKSMEMKELQAQHDKKIQEIRVKFFTNISHEFRNPLTLILGTIEKMRQDKKFDDDSSLVLIRNVKRLLKLVDDVMDFKKVESGEPRLQVQKEDLYSFMRQIVDDYKTLSYVKHKNFEVYIPQGEQWGWIDEEVVTKIILNLLNSAFKYSKENSTIQLGVLAEDEVYLPAFKWKHTISNYGHSEHCLRFYIRDNGVGIPENSIGDIFNQYYQIQDSDNDMYSGINLAFVKSLVLLHKGKISVSSELHNGTDFYFTIPCDSADYSFDEHLHKAYVPSVKEYPEEVKAVTNTKQIAKSDKLLDKKYRILVVEDDAEVRDFLVGCLCDKYQVVEAVNGVEALQKMQAEVPDMVVSDLMMSEMDGGKLCKKIKENPKYDSIPFILLTANKTQEAQIDGIQSGADAYLNKPISIQLLETTITNLLESRKRMQNYLSVNYLSTAISENLQNKDKEFYNQLISVIENNLSDPDFDVSELSTQIGYSRTRLYNKVKQTTGLPIKELIRLIRIRKAAQLMTEEGMSIPDVLLHIGIQSQSYFTVLFKREYGKTPATFVRELKNGSKNK